MHECKFINKYVNLLDSTDSLSVFTVRNKPFTYDSPVSNVAFLLLPSFLSFPLVAEDENDDPTPGDVDDRCESDISGVAGDTSDLSSALYQLGDDAPLTADDVPRSYCHQPNERLDAVLTTIALLALFLALGVGIGHFIGKLPTTVWLILQVLFCRHGSEHFQNVSLNC